MPWRKQILISFVGSAFGYPMFVFLYHGELKDVLSLFYNPWSSFGKPDIFYDGIIPLFLDIVIWTLLVFLIFHVLKFIFTRKRVFLSVIMGILITGIVYFLTYGTYSCTGGEYNGVSYGFPCVVTSYWGWPLKTLTYADSMWAPILDLRTLLNVIFWSGFVYLLFKLIAILKKRFKTDVAIH